MQIRTAALADASTITQLSVELGYPATAEEIASRLSTLLTLPTHFVAVAVDSSFKPRGWVVAERRLLLQSGERAELVGLVVAANARRMGLGRALVAAAEQWAARQGLDSISVRSNSHRAESHRFYQGIGYIRIKTQHIYVKQLVSS